MTLSLVPSGRGKGACYGGVAPLRGPFPNPRIPPPYLALRLCVHCPPVPTKASLSEQAGAHIHPRMRGGMKSGQGIPLRAYPGPPPEGLPGCGHDLRKIALPVGLYGGKGVGMTWGLGVPLQAARAAFSSLPRPEGAGDRDGTSTDKRNFGSFGYGVLLSIAQNIFKARQAGRRGVSVNIKYVFQ